MGMPAATAASITPRARSPHHFQTIDPGPGETIYDGACGSAGFLCEAFDRLCNANPKRTTVQDKALQVATFSGKDKKFLAYVIGIKNLILSDDADPNSMPGLEILNDEVRCSHGATNGPVSADELFYMEARGIPADKARRLIVNGFFNSLLARLENEVLRTHLEALLAARLAIV